MMRCEAAAPKMLHHTIAATTVLCCAVSTAAPIEESKPDSTVAPAPVVSTDPADDTSVEASDASSTAQEATPQLSAPTSSDYSYLSTERWCADSVTRCVRNRNYITGYRFVTDIGASFFVDVNAPRATIKSISPSAVLGVETNIYKAIAAMQVGFIAAGSYQVGRDSDYLLKSEDSSIGIRVGAYFALTGLADAVSIGIARVILDPASFDGGTSVPATTLVFFSLQPTAILRNSLQKTPSD